MRSFPRFRAALGFAALVAVSATAAPGDAHLFGGIVQQTPYFGSPVSYATPNGQSDAMSAYNRASMLVPITCTARDLRLRLDSADLGYIAASATLVVNGIDTALTCALPGSQSTCSDTTHTVAILAGSSVALKISPALPSRPISNVDADIEVKLPFSWRCVE